jgi:hypothetical protein
MKTAEGFRAAIGFPFRQAGANQIGEALNCSDIHLYVFKFVAEFFNCPWLGKALFKRLAFLSAG